MAPPLAGIRVVELAGLAPVPYAGLLLADFGATVLRIDRPHPSAHTTSPPKTPDTLTRNKSSIALDLKSPPSVAILHALLRDADVLLEPFRPGVLESLGLDPQTLRTQNPRLIVARLTGFRRDGKYKDMAGHDINYLAVSGILSQLGRAGYPPSPPTNLLGDFAGGGLMCAFGIVMALLAREKTGEGQVVEENMVDAVSSIGACVRLGRDTMWKGPRGTNLLDGGSPFYDTYATQDGKYVAVGALEPQFFARLLSGLELQAATFPDGALLSDRRMDPATWPFLRALFTRAFASRTRAAWEAVFDGTDACVTPVLEHGELEASGHQIRAAVGLSGTPGVHVVGTESWRTAGLGVGEGGEAVLREWLGWTRGAAYEVESGALVLKGGAKARL